MFPVISQLRRSALKIIYTRSPDLSFSGRHYAYCLTEKKWVQASTVRMSEACISSDRPEERAVKMCVFENELYSQAGLEKIRYTLVLGPEEEEENTRTFRFLILKGIVMTENNRIKKVRPASPSGRARAPLPAGTIVDER